MYNRHYEKVGNSEPKCIEDELPFDIPDSWEIIRLSTICWLTDAPKTSGEKLPYLDARTLRGKGIENFLLDGKVVDAGTKVILVDGENSGEVFVIPFRGYMGSTFKIIGMVSLISDDYLNSILNFYKDMFRGSKVGAAIPHLNKNLFKSLLIGLPPLGEQFRIVTEIERLFAQIDIIEQSQKELETLYSDLKKKTLDLAIRGKLVPQYPNDEPASVLIEKIRAERRTKLGKKYVDSYIYKGDDNCYYEKIGLENKNISENIPFDIPDSWAWARLGDNITLLSGRDLEPSQYNDNHNGIPYITGASNFDKCNLIINRWTASPVVISRKGDLLITCKGTIGTMAYNCIGDLHIARQVMAINSTINIKYIEVYLNSKIAFLQAKSKSMIPGISRVDIENSLIPIPPLKEQLLIIQRVNQILTQVEDEN